MFNIFRQKPPIAISKTNLDTYYKQRSLMEALSNAEQETKQRQNTTYKESRRPSRSCDEVLFYRNYTIERYGSEYGDTFRILQSLSTSGGRFGNNTTTRDVGLEFERIGDAYNYIDDIN